MQYTFTCPLEGCSHVMTVEDQNEVDALEKLTEVAREHLKLAHPEVKKTDEEVRQDIQRHMVTVNSN